MGGVRLSLRTHQAVDEPVRVAVLDVACALAHAHRYVAEREAAAVAGHDEHVHIALAEAKAARQVNGGR